MKIIVEVTHTELSELGLTKDRLGVVINQALDKATLPGGQSVDLNVCAEVKLVSE